MVLKEVRIRPKTGEHDYQVKFRRCQKFLEKGYKAWGWRLAFECASDSCGSCAERSHELADADAVLAAIEKVTPL